MSLSKKSIFVDISEYMGFFFRIAFRLTNGRVQQGGQFRELEGKCKQKAQIPDQSGLAEKCAVYFHSSGTTGEPKTVMHSHHAINNSAQNMIDYFGWYEFQRERVLSELPTFHGFGFVGNLHVIMHGGGQLFQIAKWDRKYAVRIIDHKEITLLAGIPKVYLDLLSVPTFIGNSLKQCFIAGDSVPVSIKHAFNARIKKKCIFEAYGMTEIVAACCACDESHDCIDSSGYPINNCRLSVLVDNVKRDCGRGELLVSTNSMMLGYLNDPESESSCFFNENDISWLRTGDYGRIDEDGYVYCEGRMKDIIIHNGYTVFPKQLERIAREVDGVDDVCVIGVFDESIGSERISAYVVSDCERNSIKYQLRKKWSELLPAYAIPGDIHFIDELPRNSMGKIDKSKMEFERIE